LFSNQLPASIIPYSLLASLGFGTIPKPFLL
jgi:hypothetical protein